MKFEEAVATSSCMFCKPLLWSEYDKRDQEAEKALYHLKKMKRDKSKDKDIKHVEKLLFYKSKVF